MHNARPQARRRPDQIAAYRAREIARARARLLRAVAVGAVVVGVVVVIAKVVMR